jgi:hypothetical protein
VVFTVENPDGAASTNRLKITDADGLTSDFEFRTNGWMLVKAGGVQKQMRSYSPSGQATRSVTNEIRDANDALVGYTRDSYETYSFGLRPIESVTGASNNVSTNSYLWYTNTASYTTGLLRQVTQSDGSWEVREYDTNRFPTNVVMAFLNVAPTNNGSVARHFDHGYGTNAIPGAGDRGTWMAFEPRRTVEYVLGHEIGRSYVVLRRFERHDIQCVTPGAAWTNGDNLVTITRDYTNGVNAGRDRVTQMEPLRFGITGGASITPTLP